MDEDKDDPNINKVIFSDYLIQKKIGKGSFGTVYSGIIISTNQKIAFKLEKRNGDCPGILETEACRLYLLQGEGIPKIVCYGNNRTDNILIQELLGYSLEELFNNLGKKFSLKTVCNVGIQLIKRIRHVHKKYHIHRDIKPDNFMTGYYKSDNRIYLIDFGLSKKYFSSTKQEHIKFKSGKNLVGTARYCSRNAHKGFELSRRDDVESIGYCLIYFLKGFLPWQGLKVKKVEEQFRKIAEKKCQTSFEELTKDLPAEFLQYFRHCDKLGFEDEPNYDYLIALFKNALSKYCNDCNYDYDWKKNMKEINNSNSNTALLKMIYNNSRNISMINNLSAIDSKGEEKENKQEIIISKELLNEERENININEIKIREEKKDDKKEEEEKNGNKIRNQLSNRFLPPKKLEDFFTEGDFKSEEISFSDFSEKETNKVNNDNNNNIRREEEKRELSKKTEENKSIKEHNKENKIINNFNINININKEDKKSEVNIKENKENINKNIVNKNINNVTKKEDVVYEYEYGIIESNKRNRYKKLEGNIDDKKMEKEKSIKCDCIIV